jgi:hypothetical protein
MDHQNPESESGPMSIGIPGVLIRLMVTLVIAVVSLLIIRYVIF